MESGGPLSNSVSQWIANLQLGDADAVQRLWDRYFEELVKFARERLGASPRQARDEEDVALSVFDSFCRGAERCPSWASGHLGAIDDPDLPEGAYANHED
jgi:hypothetical protein